METTIERRLYMAKVYQRKAAQAYQSAQVAIEYGWFESARLFQIDAQTYAAEARSLFQ